MNDGASDAGGPRDEPNGDPSVEDLEARRRRLSKTLADHRDARDAAASEREGAGTGYAAGMRLAVDFTAGVVVGAALGWLFDRWLGTTPWGLMLFLLLGCAAGVLNVLRSAGLVAEPGVKSGRDGTGAGNGGSKDDDRA